MSLATTKRGQRLTKSKAISIVLYHMDREINQSYRIILRKLQVGNNTQWIVKTNN